MYRAIIPLVILIGLSIYVRHQFNTVMRTVTTKPSPSIFPTTKATRHKCLLCGGTGRMKPITLNPKPTDQSKTCPSCKGTGWIESPAFGK